MSDSPQLTLFAGPNGSGKTSVYFKAKKVIPSLRDVNYINPDEIAYKESLSPIEAGKRALYLRNKCLQQKESFVIETTLAGKTELDLISEARKYGYKTNLIYVRLEDVDCNIARVQCRVSNGRHNIPVNDIRRRFDRSEENFIKVIQEVDRVILIDNTTSAIKILVHAERTKGIWQSKNLPQWSKKLASAIVTFFSLID